MKIYVETERMFLRERVRVPEATSSASDSSLVRRR
jgi:hypothetical protein